MTSNDPIGILLIEDEEYDVRRVRNTLRPFANRIAIHDVVSNGRDALELLEQHPSRYDVVIMDYQIAGGLSGEALIQRIKGLIPELQIIVVTKMTINVTDFDFANRLMTAGAIWYCTKYPGDIEDYIYQPTDFILSIFNAYEKKRLEQAQRRSERKLDRNIREILETRRLVGQSEPVRHLRQLIQQCAETDTTVLIRGGSGTGKELVAANIHFNSARRFESFVPINCGSLPADLIESELFGYEKGAFTGASGAKQGLFEVAHNGTVFLDEIAELPLSAQVKLLRVIQEGEIDKIGRTERLKVNVRIIAATNKTLEEEVRAGRFREDLYYRLNVVFIHVPELAQRPDDIPLLVRHFLERYSRNMNLETPDIEPDALKLLQEHPWPGNVRELQNVVQRMLFTRTPTIDRAIVQSSLGLRLRRDSLEGFEWSPEGIEPLRDVERSFRTAYIRYVRERTRSDAEAARRLGLAPSNYHRMCKELGLK